MYRFNSSRGWRGVHLHFEWETRWLTVIDLWRAFEVIRRVFYKLTGVLTWDLEEIGRAPLLVPDAVERRRLTRLRVPARAARGEPRQVAPGPDPRAPAARVAHRGGARARRGLLPGAVARAPRAAGAARRGARARAQHRRGRPRAALVRVVVGLLARRRGPAERAGGPARGRARRRGRLARRLRGRRVDGARAQAQLQVAATRLAVAVAAPAPLAQVRDPALLVR